MPEKEPLHPVSVIGCVSVEVTWKRWGQSLSGMVSFFGRGLKFYWPFSRPGRG